MQSATRAADPPGFSLVRALGIPDVSPLVAIVVLNLFDALMTSYWVGRGWASEANPVMAEVLHLGVLPFVLSKVSLVILCAWLLHRLQPLPVARLALVGAALLYAALAGYHVGHGIWVHAL